MPEENHTGRLPSEEMVRGKSYQTRHPGIYKRRRADGTLAWEVRAYDPARGKTLPKGTYDTCEAARKRKREFEDSCSTNRSSIVVARYVDLFLARRSEATRRTHRYALVTFIREFGERPIAALEWTETRMWAHDQPEWRTDAVRALLNSALDDGLITANPVARLGRRRSRGRRDIVAVTPEEIDLLAKIASEVHGAVFGVLFAAMIGVAAWTGLRPSELFAMGWDWVSFPSWAIAVRGQLERSGEFKSATKTGGHRTIVLPPPAAEALTTLPRSLEAAPIFRTKRGTPFSLSKLHYYWDPVRRIFETRIPAERLSQFRDARDPDRPDMDFYELRHFCATFLLEQGIDAADVGRQLGCSERKIIEVYGHPRNELGRERIKDVWRKPPRADDRNQFKNSNHAEN
jgi:integrase